MQGILIFIAGFSAAVVFIALLSANKPDDVEHEKSECYKSGYSKGFEDGYGLRTDHLK